MQEEVEGRNFSKGTICFSGETPRDTYRLLYGDIICDFRSHSKEAVVHAGMDGFHKTLVAGVAVTTTHASTMLILNREIVVHSGMNDFHMLLVSGVAVTVTHVSAILTVNRDKKCEIYLELSR